MTAFQPIAAAQRIAVLIDGDNVLPDLIDRAFAAIASLGIPAIRRAYGDWTDKAALTATLQANAVRMIHQPKLNKHKNGTDIALSIDAIELLYTQPIDAFALLSSDCDFTPLAIRLREAGCEVYGLGDHRAPLALRDACSRFITLDAPGSSLSGRFERGWAPL